MERKKFYSNVPIFTFIMLSLSLVTSISYLIYISVLGKSILSIIGGVILIILALTLTISGFYIENTKARIFITIGSILLTIYTLFLFFTSINKKEKLIDFTNYDINEVISWAKEKDISLKVSYSYSDTISEFHVISQDIEEGTYLSKVDILNVIVSNGIDPNKRTNISNMIGWNLDDVIKYVDDNKLTNVSINFKFSNDKKDTIIDQDKTDEIKRDDKLTLTSSLGRESEQESVVMEKLVNKDLWHAIIYLGRNNIKYNIKYKYSDKDENIVLEQSIKKLEVIGKDRNKTMTLTVSKKDLVTMTNLKGKTYEDAVTWAAQNRVRIDEKYVFDEKIKKGLIIDQSINKDTNIASGTLINITISKGQLRMIDFNNIDNFKAWANENQVSYKIDYEYSDKVKQGEIIKISHKYNDIIKNNDVINIILSDGGNTTIPNFIGLTKDEALKKCNDLKCNFVYLNDNSNYTIITNQSMRENSVVPISTSITLTIGK